MKGDKVKKKHKNESDMSNRTLSRRNKQIKTPDMGGPLHPNKASGITKTALAAPCIMKSL